MFRAITIPAAFAALLLSGFFCRAQHTFRFADSTAVWNVCHTYLLEGPQGVFGSSGTVEYNVVSDTFFNNLFYQKITPGYSALSTTPAAFLRQDSTGKVFIYDSELQSERLIYDFGLNKGDTLRLYIHYPFNFPFDSDTVKFVIDSTDSVGLGALKKRMFVRCVSENCCFFCQLAPDIIIQGIGSSLSHFLSPCMFECVNFPGQQVQLLSYQEKGTTYQFPSSCSVNVPELKTIPIKIYPNPASNHLYAEGVKHPATFHLYDIAGKEVLSTRLLTGTNRIEITNLAGGVYFYKLASGQQMGKVVIEK